MKVSINKILENMPKNLTDLEKVRYIYLKMGDIFSYNRDFLYIDDYRYVNDMYNEVITKEKIEKGNYKNKIASLCKQMSEISCETINKLNPSKIKARIVGYNPDKETHVEVIVTISDKSYNLNINLDLYKIQKGMRTVGFATTNKAIDETECVVLSSDEIKKMDEKLNYCKYGMYMDDAIEMIKSEMQDTKNIEKLISENELKTGRKEDIIFKYKVDFIFKYLKNNLPEDKKLEIYELCKYYKKLFKELLTEKERVDNNIQKFDIYLKEDGKNKKENALYQIKMRERIIYYLYFDEERGFAEIDEKSLRNLDNTGNIEYIDYLKLEYLKKQKSDFLGRRKKS